MAVIPIEPPPSRHAAPPRNAILALGFRPFFLLAGLAAVALVALWMLAWMGRLPVAGAYYGTVGWHSHEMLFGYAAAVIAGFLLTAVRNWTGLDTPDGLPLAGLALLWLAGRVAALLPLPGWIVAAVDFAFLPLVAVAVYPALMQGKNRVNRLFLPLLAAMAVANGLVHLQALGLTADTAGRGTLVMLDLVLLLVLVVTGRVVAFFTERGVAGSTPRNREWLEQLGFAAAIALALADLAAAPATIVGALCAALAVQTVAREVGWHDRRVWRNPVLWVLHAAVVWLAVGFAMRAAAAFGLVAPNVGLHALTVGGIGVLTLGMMSRVTLGHTGRDMRSPATAVIAFVLLNLAALARGIAPALWPERYLPLVHAAAGLWILAFALFLVAHAAMLWRPRVDGRPG
jgi:uncharacterized protein involved in response to NO